MTQNGSTKFIAAQRDLIREPNTRPTVPRGCDLTSPKAGLLKSTTHSTVKPATLPRSFNKTVPVPAARVQGFNKTVPIPATKVRGFSQVTPVPATITRNQPKKDSII